MSCAPRAFHQRLILADATGAVRESLEMRNRHQGAFEPGREYNMAYDETNVV